MSRHISSQRTSLLTLVFHSLLLWVKHPRRGGGGGDDRGSTHCVMSAFGAHMNGMISEHN